MSAGSIGAKSRGDGEAGLPPSPSDSYRELIELDGAHSVRWSRPLGSLRPLEPDPLDLEILALIASLRHVLTTQVHRRFNPGRAATTTQRRLKRLADAGLVERFQFHRRDGGGVPMCHVITAAGRRLLCAHDLVSLPADHEREDSPASPATAARRESASRLRQARHDVHVAGWALALGRILGGARPALRGPDESVLYPPRRSTPDGTVAFGPDELRLPGGRSAHDFLRTIASGERVPVERFETVRPDAIVELPGGVRGRHDGSSRQDAPPSPEDTSAAPPPGRARPAAIDLLVELDDRLPVGRGVCKLERYDHFLAGWAVHTHRYGRRSDAIPVVIFVCRDRARARECARRADSVLRACRAYAGEYPFDWDYPGREGVLFVAERDVHEGLLRAYAVPRLPPEVRVTVAHDDPRAGEAVAEALEIPGAPAPLDE